MMTLVWLLLTGTIAVLIFASALPVIVMYDFWQDRRNGFPDYGYLGECGCWAVLTAITWLGLGPFLVVLARFVGWLK